MRNVRPQHGHPDLLREARRLWRALRRLVDPVDHWQASENGDGPFRRNTFRNPCPIVLKNGLRVPRAMTFDAFVRHLTTRQAILLVNREDAAKVIVRVDVDVDVDGDGDEPVVQPDDAICFAHRLNLEQFAGRGFVCRSRGNGAGVYLLLDLGAVKRQERAATLRLLGRRLGTLYPRRARGGPFVEAVKGGRDASAENPLFDPELAASRVGTGPRHRARFYYRNDAWVEHGYEATRAEHYDWYRAHYVGEFRRHEALEPRAEPRFDEHSTVLAPCVFRAGDGDEERVALVREATRWLETSVPLAPADLGCLLGEQGGEVDAARRAQRRAARLERMRAIDRLLAVEREEERRAGAAEAGRGVLPNAARVWEMIDDGTDKLRQTNGVVFLSILARGHFDEELAHELYERHVAGGRPRDARRNARIRSAGRRAEGRYRGGGSAGAGAGGGALAALERQACTPAWFGDAEIERTVANLQKAGVTKADLGQATWKVAAVIYLTVRKNVWLYQHGRPPACVDGAERLRAFLREAFGLRCGIERGVPVPQSALAGMLSHLRLRNNGSAIHDAMKVLTELVPAIACADRSYCSGAFDERGNKLGEGHCRRYELGCLDLAGRPVAVGRVGREPVGGAGSPVLFSHPVCSPARAVGLRRERGQGADSGRTVDRDVERGHSERVHRGSGPYSSN